jgi:hypothetical protein
MTRQCFGDCSSAITIVSTKAMAWGRKQGVITVTEVIFEGIFIVVAPLCVANFA